MKQSETSLKLIEVALPPIDVRRLSKLQDEKGKTASQLLNEHLLLFLTGKVDNYQCDPK